MSISRALKNLRSVFPGQEEDDVSQDEEIETSVISKNNFFPGGDKNGHYTIDICLFSKIVSIEFFPNLHGDVDAVLKSFKELKEIQDRFSAVAGNSFEAEFDHEDSDYETEYRMTVRTAKGKFHNLRGLKKLRTIIHQQ